MNPRRIFSVVEAQLTAKSSISEQRCRWLLILWRTDRSTPTAELKLRRAQLVHRLNGAEWGPGARSHREELFKEKAHAPSSPQASDCL